MRKKIIAGNWKMYKTREEGLEFLEALKKKIPETTDRVILCAPYLSLEVMQKHTNDVIEIASQNVHYAEEGAFTGEISAHMLKAIGIKETLIGHSERRQYFSEGDDIVQKKVRQALNHQMEVILCVGEHLSEREEGVQESVVTKQLQMALEEVSTEELAQIMIAYEPVWAIGTGKTASAADAQQMCAVIRSVVGEAFSEEIAESISILYGGSVNPGNIKELMAQRDIDGALVGGASLKVDSFLQLIQFRDPA